MSERDRNSMGTDDPVDAGLSHLYREGARETPPPHVDAAIRAAARREVGARPRRTGTFAARWRLPLALAAVLVLSVSLVTLMMDEGGEELSAPPRPKTTAPAGSDGPVTEPPPAMIRPEGIASEQAVRKREAPAAAEAPARAPAELEPGRAVGPGGKRDDRALPSAAQPEVAVQPFPAAPPASVPARPEALLRERAAEPEFDKPAAPLAQRAPAAAADKLMAEESRAAAGVAGRDAVASRAKSQALSTLSPPVARQVQALEGEPPAKWLERIELLRREGKAVEADELLAEFKRRFPGHPLPPGEAK